MHGETHGKDAGLRRDVKSKIEDHLSDSYNFDQYIYRLSTELRIVVSNSRALKRKFYLLEAFELAFTTAAISTVDNCRSSQLIRKSSSLCHNCSYHTVSMPIV